MDDFDTEQLMEINESLKAISKTLAGPINYNLGKASNSLHIIAMFIVTLSNEASE